jgi:hypothetical protein
MKKLLGIFALLILVMAVLASPMALPASARYRLNMDADDPLEDLPAELLWTENLSRSELAESSKETLEYMRNRLYAHRGFIFKSKKWRDEFSRFDWYEPDEDFSYALFNKFERENMRRILAAEKDK